jgi:CTP:molybdopterin cytidylyltransferase MocA/NifU-like protein involved in Fe-S cluster formation
VPNPYSPTLIAHFRKPRNQGALAGPSITQEGTNPLCGDRVRIELLVEQDIVRDARFTANACAICVASASMLTDLVKKAPLDEIETLTVDDILHSLNAQVPPARMNCVRLPLTVMHTGVHRYRRRRSGTSPEDAAQRQTAHVAAVVLAAGRARRFGAQKLVAPFGDATVIRQVVERVGRSGVSQVTVVVGPDATPIQSALAGLDVQWATNPEPERGMSSSIAAGIGTLPPNVDAVLVALGDQPTVLPDVLEGLMQAWSDGRGAIIAPRYRGRRGNPVLFDRALFNELRALTGDRGARDLLDAQPERVHVLDVDAPMPMDIDTPGDYDALLRSSRATD